MTTGESITEWCARQPKRQHSFEVKGWILHLPRIGLTVVPVRQYHWDGWDCIVVDGNDTYSVVGSGVYVSGAEIECAIRLLKYTGFGSSQCAFIGNLDD